MTSHLSRSVLVALGLLVACQTTADSTPATAQASPAPKTASTASASTAGSTAPDTVVATWDGGKITYGEVAESIGARLIQMEVEYLSTRYSTEQQAVDQLMVEKMVEAEAAAQGMDAEKLIEQEVVSKTSPPTEAEIQEMYAAMARQLRGAPLEQVRDVVAQQVSQRKQTERFGEWVAALKERKKADVTLPFPDMPRMDVDVDDDPMVGPADAPVTIIQFAEYQCPYCGKADDIVQQVLKDYDGKVNMVFRDFPLSFHPRAIPAAIAANCAGEQGKYWELHNRMIHNQRALEETDLVGYANEFKLDVAAWETCRKDPKQRDEVMADFAAGQAVGVTGTPAFFINGIMLSGALPYEMFAQIIDKELGEG